MFSWFKRKQKFSTSTPQHQQKEEKYQEKKKNRINNTTRPSIASDPFRDTNNSGKRWSSSVKLEPNLISSNSLNIRPVIREEEYEAISQQQEEPEEEEEEGKRSTSDDKLDVLRGTKGGKRDSSSTFTGIVGGRTLQRKIVDIGQSSTTIGAGERNVEFVGESLSNTSLSGKKSVKKLQKRESTQSHLPNTLMTSSSTHYSLAPGQTPSRISNYWHDLPPIDPLSTNPNDDDDTSNPTNSNSNPTAEPKATPTLSNSNELASRLAELAISYSDGLVDEEEYRLLRNEVFLRFTGGEVGDELMGAIGEGNELIPKLDEFLCVPKAFGLSPHSNNESPSTLSLSSSTSTNHLPRAPSSQSIAFNRAKTSISNGSSQLFRKSSTSDLEEDWNVVNPRGLAITELLNHQIENDLALVNSYSSNSLAPPMNGNGSSTFQPRSLRNYPGLPIRTDVRLVPGSLSRQDRSLKSNRSSTSNNSLPSRTRLSPDSFTPHNLSITKVAQPISLNPYSFATTDAEPTSLELKLEISQLESEWSRLSESWETLERVEINKWEDKLGPIGLDYFVNHSAKPPSELSNLDKDEPNYTLSEPNLKRTVVLNSKDTRLSNLDLTTSSLPSVSSRQTHHSIPSNSPTSLAEEVNQASEELLIVVEGIRSRKRKTELKYEERLEYLRSRLSGALLKERIQDQ